MKPLNNLSTTMSSIQLKATANVPRNSRSPLQQCARLDAVEDLLRAKPQAVGIGSIASNRKAGAIGMALVSAVKSGSDPVDNGGEPGEEAASFTAAVSQVLGHSSKGRRLMRPTPCLMSATIPLLSCASAMKSACVNPTPAS